MQASRPPRLGNTFNAALIRHVRSISLLASGYTLWSHRSDKAGLGDPKFAPPTQNYPSVIAGEPNSTLRFVIAETCLCEPRLRHSVRDIDIRSAPMLDENPHHS